MRLALPLAFSLALATPAFAACEDDLKASLDTLMAAGPYHVTMTSEANGAQTVAEADVILPDKFRVSVQGVEMLMIKNKTWMNMGGTWQAMPGEMAASIGSMIDAGIKNGMKGVSGVQCLGAQEYEGGSYDAIVYDASGEAMGIKATSKITLYKDAGGMPAWMVIEGEAMGMKSKTVQKITADSSITINPP